jgi:hypothetical protein
MSLLKITERERERESGGGEISVLSSGASAIDS